MAGQYIAADAHGAGPAGGSGASLRGAPAAEIDLSTPGLGGRAERCPESRRAEVVEQRQLPNVFRDAWKLQRTGEVMMARGVSERYIKDV